MIQVHYFNISIQMDNGRKFSIKICAYHFLGNIINFKDLDPDNIKIDEESYEHILIY